MRVFTTLFTILIAFTTMASVSLAPVKYKRQDSEHIKEIMKAWDAQKGEYLYESMAALIMHQAQPEKPKGVRETPYEMLQQMGDQRLDRLNRIAQQELETEQSARRGKRDAYYWQEWSSFLNSARCNTKNRGSSNGDPHMTTFDGEKYDFQNAGDYLLTGSSNNRFMIQTQQVRSSPTISQNGAVAMNINGDVVEFRGQDLENKGMIVINGEAMPGEGQSFTLPQGGEINFTKKRNYEVKWPTGEKADIRVRNGARGTKLFDVFVHVPSCNSDQYYGLLGDNDGSRSNDLEVTGNENEWGRIAAGTNFTRDELFGAGRRTPGVMSRQQERGNYISYVYSESFRLDKANSLFTDKMTDIADEVRYPEVHQTLAELSDEQVEEGIRRAQKAGISDDDLFGAVYDYGYLGIEPEVMDSDYDRVIKSEKTTEPKIDKDREKSKLEQGNQQNPVRVNPRVNIGRTVIITPPRHRTPRYRTPRTPRTPTYGSPTRPTTSPSPNTSNGPRRTPSSGGGTPPTRTPRR